MSVLYDGIEKEDWKEELNSIKGWPARHLLASWALLGIPPTFFDVGCGNGETIDIASKFCSSCLGLDQLISNKEERPQYKHWNLVEYYKSDDIFNMVYCIEVAEHLHESAHATLCDTLADGLAEGRDNYLVFSAARPNQGGMGHISERPASYWREQFAIRNLSFRKDLTIQLALLWNNINSPLGWLADNVMVFNK